MNVKVTSETVGGGVPRNLLHSTTTTRTTRTRTTPQYYESGTLENRITPMITPAISKEHIHRPIFLAYDNWSTGPVYKVGESQSPMMR